MWSRIRLHQKSSLFSFLKLSSWKLFVSPWKVMGSSRILKVLWGANGDCQCLMSPGTNP